MPLTNTQKLIISIVVILGIWASQSVSRELQVMSMTTRHEQWMARYGHVYKDEAEMESRFKIFKENVEFIESFNNFGTHPYELEVNQFADFRNEEFLAYHTGYKMSSLPNASKTTVFGYGNMTKVPSSLDWRKKGAVTPIRNETCGAWTFPAVDTVEGLIKIKTGKLYTLSVQEIVDCYPGKNGCGSGFTNEAFDFIKHHGLTTEANYLPREIRAPVIPKKNLNPLQKSSVIKAYQPMRMLF